MRARRLVQLAFLILTIVSVFVLRAHAERWCPFGGVEAIYTYAQEGNLLCSLGVSNFYILAALLVIALLFRRAFCGYMCPIGALSEWLQSGARRMGVKPVRVHGRLDRVLAFLKYPLLAVILFFTWRTGELVLRSYDPCYALISRHGEDITFWAYVVTGAVVAVSLLVVMPFCRWLCPLAAVLHPFSRFGLTRIKRDTSTCISCTKCAQACPMAIPVDEVEQVTAARCMSCLECVAVCPTTKQGALSWGPPRRLGGSWSQAVLITVMLLSVALAVTAACVYPIPSFVQSRGDAPAEIAAAELRIENLTCRGRGTLLWYYLTRDDIFAVEGYLKLEAWPGPGAADARVIYDPRVTAEQVIKDAIVEPYFDSDALTWRPSPFVIEGYDPLGLDGP